MDRETSAHNLDQRLEALDLLSMGRGLTNRELNRWLKDSDIPSTVTERELGKALERIEKNEGNFSRDVTGPLLTVRVIYKTEGKYPNKSLYINKFIDNMHKIQHDLADEIEGRIWYYDKIHHIEHAKMRSRKTSEKHAKAHGVLTSFIHLYIWCNQIKKEIDSLVTTHKQHYDSFCLVTQPPPCKCCQAIEENAKMYQYYQDMHYILTDQDTILELMKTDMRHRINSVEELKLAARQMNVMKSYNGLRTV